MFFEWWPSFTCRSNPYVDQHHPGHDIAEFTIWEIGFWDVKQIYNVVQEIVPEIYAPILAEEYGSYLPQNHLRYWEDRVHQATFWTCKYCTFWCDHFDQRIMEIHLARCHHAPKAIHEKIRIYIREQNAQQIDEL